MLTSRALSSVNRSPCLKQNIYFFKKNLYLQLCAWLRFVGCLFIKAIMWISSWWRVFQHKLFYSWSCSPWHWCWQSSSTFTQCVIWNKVINVPLHPRVLHVQPFFSTFLSFSSHCSAGLQKPNCGVFCSPKQAHFSPTKPIRDAVNQWETCHTEIRVAKGSSVQVLHRKCFKPFYAKI